MKIDFCPNKQRLISLSFPLQLNSVDSRSPSGLQSLPNFKMVIKMCFNSRSPSGLRQNRVACLFSFWCFNSRSPSGLRPRHFNSTAFTKGFQFTQPKRAATYNSAAACGTRLVSIHAAQAGCDHVLPTSHGTKQSFNSRSPSGLRLAEGQGTTRQTRFNSRSPSGLRLSAFTAWLGL